MMKVKTRLRLSSYSSRRKRSYQARSRRFKRNKMKKMMSRLKLSPWPSQMWTTNRWQSLSHSLRPLKLPQKSRSSRRLRQAALAIRQKLQRWLPRHRTCSQQRKTLNKNKLNKIIKHRIEFKLMGTTTMVISWLRLHRSE